MQLRAMSRTSVLITPCGGTGTVLTFLQPGATAIVMNYWLPHANTSTQMEALCAPLARRKDACICQLSCNLCSSA